MSKLNIKNMIAKLGIAAAAAIVLLTSSTVTAHAEESIDYAEDNTYTMLLEIEGIIDTPYAIRIYRRNGNQVQFIMPLDTTIAGKLRQAEMRGETVSGTMEMTSDAGIDWTHYLCFHEAHIVRTYMEYEERKSGAVDIYDVLIVEGDIYERYVVRSEGNEEELTDNAVEEVPEYDEPVIYEEDPIIYEDEPEYDEPVTYEDEPEYDAPECGLPVIIIG